MFSSKGSSKDKDFIPPSAPAAPAASAQQKRPMRSGAAPSIISADLTVTGTLNSSGDIQVDGRVEGNVHSAGLVIGDKAFILGDIVSEEVTVRGRVQGSIRARKVLLASTCHVEGDILHEAFAVETGAFFEGNCRHSDNPLGEENAKKPADQRMAAAPVSTASPAPSAAPSTPGSSPVSSPVSSMVSRPMTSSGATAATFTPLKTN